MDEMNYYDWLPFFQGICASIGSMFPLANRDTLLMDKARQTFEAQHVIFRYGVIDPFSYVYALAQRNTVNQRDEIFGRAIVAFDLNVTVPTDNIFPTPTPVTPACFYSEGAYVDKSGHPIGNECLWNLFHQVFTDAEISEADFNNVLSIRKVGFVKLSQAMFLINPSHFLPFDTQMNSLPDEGLTDLKLSAKRIEADGLGVYLSAIQKIRDNFPGCAMYEVNLLNVFLNSPGYFDFHISSRFCVISSYADGDDNDYFDLFEENSAVFTGGPGSGSGKTIYPLDEFDRGDIVLVRRGRIYLGGIGIIVRNEYVEGGFTEEKTIKVIWLIKDKRRIAEGALGQWGGFSHASANTIRKFENTYPEAFRLLRRIQTAQTIMVDHKANRIKNIVLQGPPGTGKTRLAKQIAAWLTSDTPKNQTLMEAIDARGFSGDLADENEQIKLVQFHPSYSYEDFVRGIKADVTANGQVIYKVENRLLGNLIEVASLPENRSKAYVLVIDEMNRANLPSVLGELIYALEYRDKAITGMYPILLEDGSISSDLLLPDNLYVIGTMNTADRSVGHIDYAIRRRFAFVDVLPDKSPIKSVAQPLFRAVSELFIKNFASITWAERNPKLEKSDYLAPDFRPEDVWIGHSYFLTNDDGVGGKKELEIRLKYEITPILKEYLKDGILLEPARKEIENLHA